MEITTAVIFTAVLVLLIKPYLLVAGTRLLMGKSASDLPFNLTTWLAAMCIVAALS